MSDYLAALILGIVEGLTEFIPVSSTGHLILVGEAIGFKRSSAHVFEVFIQSGAILAVLVLYPARFRSFLKGGGVGFSGVAGLMKLGLAALPALIAGALLHGVIKSALFKPLPVAAGLIAGGVVMIFLERFLKEPRTRDLTHLSWRQALGVGLFQVLSLWPGVSRAGATIVGGLVLGLDRRAAAEFSFLLAVPVLMAAAGYDLLKGFSELTSADVPLFGLGFVVAFFSALLAIRVFVALLARWSLAPFGWYRVALGSLVLWLL